MRQSQSNSSSSARFSAVSLRGLIGHQTAPRRAIPNTQAKAVALLDERIPTLAPGSTPEALSAPATDQLRSCTSP